MLENFFNYREIDRFIYRPAQGGQVLIVLHRGCIKSPGLTQIRRDMFAIKGVAGFLTGLLQYIKRTDFDVQSIRIGGRVDVAEVIYTRRLEAANNVIHQLWIHQRAIARDAYHHISFVLSCRLYKALEHIVFAALLASVAQFLHMLDQWLVAHIHRCGHDNLVQLFCLGQT